MSATITSSIVDRDDLQKDGRRWIHELHTDSLGVQHPNVYMAPNAGWDANAQLAGNAANILAALAAAEVASNFAQVEALGSLASPVTHYSTAAQNTAALSATWKTLTQTQAIMIGDYLNTLSLAVLESVFGWTPAQAQNISTTYLIPYA